MILDLVTYPTASLAQICQPITEITPEIRQVAEDMLETMYDAPGVGLAAPQVGKNIRMVVIDPEWSKDVPRKPRVLINPVLTLLGDMVTSEQEGCLSVPLNYRADVQRASKVLLQAQDLDGNSIQEEHEDFYAYCLQHEIDHLDGVLFIDKIGRLRRTMYDAKVKKWLKRKTN
ncbi:MAG: peptide deformylase [Desulfovibrionaceae bacterium]|nr:peptide deformylase [Desulfovibrionaceae bacterium]